MALVLWLPIPVTLPALRAPAAARNILGTTLTVVGTVQAFAIAIIVFAAQAYANSRHVRYGGSLTDFARNTRLLLILNFGIAVLIIGGLSFVGFGPDSPGGWGGTWTLILSSLFLVLLPVLYWRTLSEIDPSRLNESRLERARQLARGMARENAILYLADSSLTAQCDRYGVELNPYQLATTPDDAVALRATATGQVKDINVRAIRELGELGTMNDTTMTLKVSLSTRVTVGQPLAAGNQPLKQQPRWRRRLVRITKVEQSPGLEFLDGLHEEALDAIRSGRPSWYQSVIATYMEYTLGPAARASEFNLPVDAAYGIRSTIFSRTPLERVSLYMYEELVVAVTGQAREIAFDAIYLPRQIAQKAVLFRSTSLFREMTRLYPAVYAAIGAHRDSPLAELMSDRAWRHLVDVIDFPLGRDVEQSSDPDDLARLIQLVAVADNHVEELLKHAIDAGDRRTFRAALKAWLDTLLFWEPEHARPDLWDVDRLREAEVDSARIKEAEVQAQFNASAAALKSQLNSDRQLSVFGLSMWALDVARRGSGSPAGEMFLALQDQLETRDSLLAAAHRALGAIEDHSYSSWFMHEQPDGTIRVGSADAELLAAFVAIVLLRVSDNEMSELPPLEWLPHRLDQAMRLVEDLSSDHDLMVTLRIADPTDTARQVVELLKTSAESQTSLEDEYERQLTVAEDARLSLEDHTKAGWDRTRFASRLFEATKKSEPASTLDDVTVWSLRQWVPKTFLQIDRDDDLESFGSGMGRALSQRELTVLLRAISMSPSTEVARRDVRAAASEAVRTMRDDGYEPTIVLLPVQWGLHSDLGLAWRPEGHPPPPAELALGERSIAQHLGTFEETPAFYSAEVNERHMYIIDFASVGMWRSGPDSPQQTVEVEITDSSLLQEAQNAAQNEGQALDLMKSALVESRETFAIDIEDLAAARIIHITGEPLEEDRPPAQTAE